MNTSYFVFAGNIGIGKSTAARGLAQATGAALVAELVAHNSLLERFYADPHRWAFHFQMFSLGSRAKGILDGTTAGPLIVDRSFDEDIVYVDVALDNGVISDEEYAIYRQLFEVERRLLPVPTHLFYLRTTDCTLLMGRVQARGRQFEASISREYLESLQTHYDAWFEGYAGPKSSIDIDGLDASAVLQKVIDTLSPQTF